MSQQVDLAVVRRMVAVSAHINHGHQLQDTLQAVADSVVESLGFGAAAVNYVLPDGNLKVVAVAGPADLREALEGQVVERAAWERVLARSQPWGSLRFVPGDAWPDDGPPEWVPDVEVPAGDDAWHPEDALLAVLHASDGTMVGVLSVDLPPEQRRPGPVLRELLEMFAAQAGLAIDNARLIEQLRHDHAQRQASESAFRFAFAASAEPMVTLTLDRWDFGRLLEVNDALCRCLGWNQDELRGRRWDELVVPEERSSIDPTLEKLATGQSRHVQGERQIMRADGTRIWVSASATVVEAEPTSFLLIHLQDVTDRKAQEAKLRHQAHHDPLTGLPNRAAVLGHLKSIAADPRRRAGALYCDLDGFKVVNDQHGHATGDRVLKDVASRLRAEVGTCGLVGRLGGDEFFVVAADADRPAADRLAERLRAAFRHPLPEIARAVTISVGVAVLTPDDRDPDRVLHRADAAMYADKRARHSTV